jgi:predicted nucleic acid-binding protein
MDTNVLLRHFMQDHEDHSPRSSAYIRAIASGEHDVHVTDQAVFEAIYLMEKLYKVPRRRTEELLGGFLDLEGVHLAAKQRWADILSLYSSTRLSAVDAFHAIVMQREGITEIISFDTDFDAIATITRIEP